MQLKPITVVAVLLLVIASLFVAGCTSSTNTSSTSKGVEITARQSGPQTFSQKAGGGTGLIKAGEKYYEITASHSITVKITNHGPGDFPISNITFYNTTRKDDQTHEAKPDYLKNPNGAVPDVVKAGETLELIYIGVLADTLRYDDGTGSKTVTISAN